MLNFTEVCLVGDESTMKDFFFKLYKIIKSIPVRYTFYYSLYLAPPIMAFLGLHKQYSELVPN